MKKVFRGFAILLTFVLTLSNTLVFAMAESTKENNMPNDSENRATAPLVLQKLNYNENTVDIPNPDRGFYRQQSYVIPVESGTTPEFPNLSTTITGTSVTVTARIVHMEFDLRNFSSNAPLNKRPVGPWSAEDATPPDYGKTQPLTTAALDYVRAAFQRIRNSEAVAIVRFSYDGNGYTYINSGTYDQHIHDCEPGAPQGRIWYETDIREESDLCGISGHENKNWVQYHIWQLGSVFSEFEDCIMAVDGGFFGPWGEMHSSSYAKTAEGFHWLLEALLAYVPESRSILVPAGGVMAWHNTEYNTAYSFVDLMPSPEQGTPAKRFGMFNDSYSAGVGNSTIAGSSTSADSYSDNGSLSEGSRLLPVRTFNRTAALDWIRNQNNFYGGETVATNSDTNIYPRFPYVPYEAAYVRSSHLNTSWNQTTYKLWSDFIYNEENVTAPFTPPHDKITRTALFDPVYNGRNGMEFMRDRLGYRLVLRDANASEWVEEDGLLVFRGKLQNVGFGNVVNKKAVSVILKSKTGSETYIISTNLDARDWLVDDNGNCRADNTVAYRDLNFNITMDAFGKVPVGDYDIYLKINDPKETSKNRRCIQFANFDIWNAALGANRIGSTSVVAAGIASKDVIDLKVENNTAIAEFYPNNPMNESIKTKYILTIYDADGNLVQVLNSGTNVINANTTPTATPFLQLILPMPQGGSAKAFVLNNVSVLIRIAKSVRL